MSDQPDNLTNPESVMDLQRVKAALGQLDEHFDSVQIFVTRHEAGIHDGTKHFALGSGNFFARYGQIQQWMAANDQESREIVKRNARSE